MLTSTQFMMLGAGIAVAVAGAGVVGYGAYKKMMEEKKYKPLTPWIGRHLSGDMVIEDEDVRRLRAGQRDIEIEDEDVHRLQGPRPISSCKRGGCASVMGRSTFGY
jgi:hypothetical protein